MSFLQFSPKSFFNGFYELGAVEVKECMTFTHFLNFISDKFNNNTSLFHPQGMPCEQFIEERACALQDEM